MGKENIRKGEEGLKSLKSKKFNFRNDEKGRNPQNQRSSKGLGFMIIF
jgi:hypothetical protein